MWSRHVKCHDLSTRVNVHALKPDFHRLTRGPKVALYKVQDAQKINLTESESIYPDLDILPGHGRIAFARALDIFVHESCPNAKHIYAKAQRTTCHPESESRVYCLLDHGTHHDFQHIGVLCVARENIIGGLQRWRKDNQEVCAKELRPGDMVFFNSHDVQHNIANISPLFPQEEGHLDMLVFFGNC